MFHAMKEALKRRSHHVLKDKKEDEELDLAPDANEPDETDLEAAGSPEEHIERTGIHHLLQDSFTKPIGRHSMTLDERARDIMEKKHKK